MQYLILKILMGLLKLCNLFIKFVFYSDQKITFFWKISTQPRQVTTHFEDFRDNSKTLLLELLKIVHAARN